MPLEKYQFEMELNTIYELFKFSDDFPYFNPNIFFKGAGEVNVYTDENLPSSKEDMYLEHEEIQGHKAFLVVPKYIYIEQTSPTIDEIIISGVKPVAVV